MSVTVISQDNFAAEVLQADKPVMVDFWAPWCGPCKMLAPIVEQMSETDTDVKFCKANVDEQSALAAQFGVSSIPTLVFFKGGKKVGQSVGFQTAQQLKELLDKAKSE